MKILVFIVALICTINVFAKEEYNSAFTKTLGPPPTPIKYDSLIFDLQNSIISVINGVSYLDLPIYLKAVNSVQGFDIQMQFNQTKMTYVTTTKIISQLDPFSYLNPNDQYLRNTTPGPSLSYQVPVNTPLLYFRFQLANACTQVDANDFYNIGVILNSSFARSYVTLPKSNSASANITTGVLCSANDIPFTYSSTSYGRTIQTYNWDFGNNISSNLQSPKVNFSQEGIYVVKLVTTTVEGCKDSLTKSIVINPSPVSNFLYSYDLVADTVSFTNLLPLASASTLTWEWNFGDQTTSVEKEPKHQYNVGGTYHVSLLTRTSEGCTSLFVSDVIINKPTADFISSPNKCTNENVTFTNASTFSGGVINSWSWDFGDSNTSNLENPVHTYLNSGTYTVSLIVSSPQGTKGVISKNIIVNNKPIVQFEGDNLSGCSPFDVNFTDMSTTDVGSSYYWDFGDFILSPEQNPTHTFLSSRSYTIKEIITAPGGCKDSLIKNSYITVLNSPNPDFISSNGCVNTIISFTDQSTISANTIISWLWDFGDNTTSTIQNPTHIYSKTGSYTVKLTCTSNSGCSSTITKTVIINTKPTVQFNTSNISGCTPLNAFFSDLSSTAVGSTYSWDFGDNSLSNIQNPTHVYINNGSFTVKEIVIAPGGCRDSLVKTNYINVLSAISAKFSAANFCTNSVTNFKDSSTITTGTITSWNWNFGNGSSSSSQNPTYVYTIPGTYIVTLTSTSDLGCSNNFSKTVTIDAKPLVNFKADITNGCSPATVQFTNMSFAQNNSKFTWNFGDGTTLNGADTSHLYTIVDSFTVKYTVVTPQGCVDSLVKSNYINLKTSPLASYKILNASTYIPGSPLFFSNTSEGANEYYWDFGDLDYTGNINPKHIYADSGIYEVCLTASSSLYCSNTVCDTITIVGSKKLALPTAFSPNGDGKNDVFKLLGGPCKELDFKVFNEWGNLIFESQSQDLGWDGTFKGMIQPEGAYNFIAKGKTVDEKDINLFGIINLTK